MRKKYLSALLFGALLFASAGTFTSCKDYDDDISNLQGQINDVNTAITELQSAVEGGKYVTAVSNTGNTITFTFSDGTTTQVALEDQVGSVVTVQDGVLYIDGEATDIKVAEPAPTPEPGEEHKDQIIIENNMWSVLQEDGTYKTTNIPVSGVSVSGSEAEGYTFRVYASDGTYKDVKLQSATSSLTDLTLQDHSPALKYYVYTFKYDGTGRPDRDKWAGPRALPAKDGSLVAAMSTIGIQLNPTDVDGTVIDFSLIDSKNNIPSSIALSASADTELKTRAASTNGLYTLSMEDVYFDDANALNNFENQFVSSKKNKLYAVVAGKTRSAYDVTVGKANSGESLTKVNVKNGSTTVATEAVGSDPDKDNPIIVDANKWYSVTATEGAALYDMHLSVDNDDKTLYGVQIEESEGSYRFMTTTTPDNITKPIFNLVVETVDKNGTYKKTTLAIQQSAIITSGVTYDPISYEIKNKNADENYFYVSLDKMKEALGTQGVALWNTQADLASTAVKFVDTTDKNVDDFAEADGIDATFVNKNEAKVTEVSSLKDANFIQFRITNATAGANFDVNKQYNAVIDFKKNSTTVLNTITVPFTLTLPSITTLFQLDANFVIDGNAVCYMYEKDQKAGEAAFNLNRVFAKAETTGFTIALDDQTNVVDNLKSSDLASMDNKEFDGSTMVTLNDKDKNTTTGIQKGYGQVLTFHITGKYANAWEYPENEGFTFTAKILSPIYEGNVTPREGSQVVIPASDLDGYQFGNDVIIGNTYNTAVTYDVLPIWKNGKSLYSREDIKAVSAKSGNTNIFTITGAPTDALPPITSGNTTVKRDGYFEMHSQNVPQTSTTTVEITVTDIWGYSKTSSVPVQITVE
ncbi:hypothetical protein H9625_12800, partial [Phocaeicola sp. Sa1CVN1]